MREPGKGGNQIEEDQMFLWPYLQYDIAIRSGKKVHLLQEVTTPYIFYPIKEQWFASLPHVNKNSW